MVRSWNPRLAGIPLSLRKADVANGHFGVICKGERHDGPMSRQRISRDGRVLRPEETIGPTAYRPEGKGRGLHAILEEAQPWRRGKPVPLDGSLKGATVLLL